MTYIEEWWERFGVVGASLGSLIGLLYVGYIGASIFDWTEPVIQDVFLLAFFSLLGCFWGALLGWMGAMVLGFVLSPLRTLSEKR
jgi:hypothetical protein